MSIRINKLIIYLFYLLLFFIFHSCLIQVCKESKYREKRATKYINQTSIKVEDIKRLLVEDTLHYKVVIIYSPCCGSCRSHMQTTYKRFVFNTDSTVKYYFITDSYDGIKYNESFLKSCGIKPDKMYYLKDTFNINKENNIVNYIFPSDDKITGEFGVPISLVISKNNKLKKAYISIDYGNGVHQYFKAMPLFYLKNYNFDEINFDKIEIEPEINWEICSPNKKK
ncbi:MAG: hypothetical protein GX330_06170 [Bacteroidales bacterium]|nr:hypothetical protein [Bacteroidales bacterium]